MIECCPLKAKAYHRLQYIAGRSCQRSRPSRCSSSIIADILTTEPFEPLSSVKSVCLDTNYLLSEPDTFPHQLASISALMCQRKYPRD